MSEVSELSSTMRELPSLRVTAALKLLLTTLQLSHEELKLVEKEVTKARQFEDHRIKLQENLPPDCASRVCILSHKETSDYHHMFDTSETLYSIQVDHMEEPLELSVNWQYNVNVSTEDHKSSTVGLQLVYRGKKGIFDSDMSDNMYFGESSSTHHGARQILQCLAKDLDPDLLHYSDKEIEQRVEALESAKCWNLEQFGERGVDIKPIEPRCDDDIAIFIIMEAFLEGVGHAYGNAPKQGYMHAIDAILREWEHKWSD